MKLFSVIVTLFTILLLISCKNDIVRPVYELDKSIMVDTAAVVSAHPLASQIGADILRSGGNAIDAAIAVQFALAVCYPVAGNIGGGGFMIYRDNQGQSYALDYREKAPLKAYPDMYLDSLGNVIKDKSLYGHLASGVPGSVDGMVSAFERFSALKDWSALLNPAIALAENGFKITKRQAKNLNNKQEDFAKYNDFTTAFNSQENWKAGDVLVQKNLAKTLTAIRDNRRDGFYSGPVAELIVAEMNKTDGIITLEDLEQYESVWREPIKGNYNGMSVISMPPPSSGGACLLQLLEMVEHQGIDSLAFQSPEAIHLMVEAERRAYADRAKHMGDADYYDVPLAQLIDSAYIVSRMSNFSPDSASISEDIMAGSFKESEQTTHFSIVDKDGNAVSITTTINTGYGSKVVVEGAGFLLNNEMDDFSAKPGEPNFFGLIGAEANKIEPGKRMLSSMTPTIIEQDGELKLVVGTPGGSTIITSVFQTILNIFTFDMTATNAVHAPRFHHQWKPDQVFLEDDALDTNTKNALLNMGHELKARGKIGKVEAIQVKPDGTLEAVADIRGDDHAVGY